VLNIFIVLVTGYFLDETMTALKCNVGELRSHLCPVMSTSWHLTLVVISEM
jgi:hypothetical protein